MEKFNNNEKISLGRSLKPAGSYLDDLSGFADLIGTINQAEKAANELLRETAPKPQKEASQTKYNDSKQPSIIDPLTERDKAGSEPGERSGEIDKDSQRLVEELLEELDTLVGLENIKKNVKSLINYVKIRKLRAENELPNPPLSLHMVFTGNPGTGKTTVSRILSKLYKAIGVLTKGQLIEVDRSGLVAGFVGQTAIKTFEAVKSALGGILFIDEAYSLAPDFGSGNDFGHEAIETLLKLMEDNREDLIVIVAGYGRQMEKFIASNPGLESRFNRYFVFEDYTGNELNEIFESMCAKSEYILSNEAKDYAQKYFHRLYDLRDENFGNARYARNFFENIVTVHSDRVSALNDHTRENLTMVLREDLEKAADM